MPHLVIAEVWSHLDPRDRPFLQQVGDSLDGTVTVMETTQTCLAAWDIAEQLMSMAPVPCLVTQPWCHPEEPLAGIRWVLVNPGVLSFLGLSTVFPILVSHTTRV